MRKSLIGVAVVAATLFVGTPRARADANPIVITFSGSGLFGTIAPGIGWDLSPGVISIPGPPSVVGPGIWPGPPTPGHIDDFTMTISSIGGGAFQILESFSMFAVRLGLWTPALSNGNHTITFTAPPGGELNSGQAFRAAIAFTPAVSSEAVTFTGGWSSPIPEPSSLLLFGSGLLLVGIIVHRKQLHAKTRNVGMIDVA